MMIAPVGIAVLSFMTAFFLVLGMAAVSRIIKHPIDDRMERIRHDHPVHPSSPLFHPLVNNHSVVASLGQRIAPSDPEKRSLSRRRLAYAGFYSESALYNYWGVKLVAAVLFPSMVVFLFLLNHTPLQLTTIPVLFSAGIGMLTPDFYLYLRKRYRQDQIFKALPDALDLLLVCVEAGLGLDAAMQKVSDELQLGSRVLSEELKVTCAAIRFGQDRNEALHDLGERTGVMDLRSLVAVLTQADKFGVSVGQALRVHADDMRTRRRQRAEEIAAKTTVKLIFPLVLFIFPAIFVVLGGPAVIRIMEYFIK